MKSITLFSALFAINAFAKISVVTTLTDYGLIARTIGGENVNVSSIVQPGEDPHYVRPKPSHVVKIKNADLFITTGLDLELWVPSLLNRAANPKVRSGQIGYVAAADGIPLIEKPTNLSRSEGGLHVYGNPHITTSPVNMITIAKNIATGLSKVDPAQKNIYEKNYLAFKQTIIKNLFGEKIPSLLGEDVILKMAEKGTLLQFLESKEMNNKKLIEILGGWFKKALPLKGKKFVSYHKNWGYVELLTGLKSIATIEVKPGVPPTPKHVLSVVQKMKNEKAQIIIGASYFPVNKMENVAQKVDAQLIVLNMNTDEKMNDIMEKFDKWLDLLLQKSKEIK